MSLIKEKATWQKIGILMMIVAVAVFAVPMIAFAIGGLITGTPLGVQLADAYCTRWCGCSGCSCYWRC